MTLLDDFPSFSALGKAIDLLAKKRAVKMSAFGENPL